MDNRSAKEVGQKQSIDLNEIIALYLKNWKWFVLCGSIALLLAFLYIRYTTPLYKAQTQIQILDDKGGGPELDVFQDLDIFSGGKNKVEDEIQLIKSRSNFMEVVKELDLNIRIYAKGNIRNTELYLNPPIKLNFIAEDSVVNKAKLEFYVTILSNTNFGYSEESDKPMKTYAFGENIPTDIGDIVITPKIEHFQKYKDQKIKVLISPLDEVAQNYRGKVITGVVEEYSNIVNISLQDPIQKKARDILDALTRIYNENAIEDKQAIADRTSDFIDERIADIYSNLSSVDQTAEEFRTERGVTDIAQETNINLNVGAANQRELAQMQNQLQIAQSMQEIVQGEDGYQTLPTNLGLSDPTIASVTGKINELVLERKRLLESVNENHPTITQLNQQIDGLRTSMRSSLRNTVDNLGQTVNTLSAQQARFNSKIYSAPRNQRALTEITRKQQTAESLYLYLLQKREEAKIAVASTAPKSKIVDRAYNSSEFPVAPKKKIIYVASLILGLLVPFSVIYAKDLLDNKVQNMYSLEKIVANVPILGELPRLSKKEEKLVVKDDRSVLAESLRIIRTNLDYLINTKKATGNKSNVVFVTSSTPGEGKTFFSANLSMTLASTNKKVLLIGADIRNPKFYTFFTDKEIDKMGRSARNKDAGLTEFIFDDTILVKDIINPMLVRQNDIDVIYSGKIPPNPAELLLSDRLEELFGKVAAKYDYVIVDTAPLMVVTDTLLISKYANHFVYVIRAGMTENKAVDFPIKLQEEGKIKGLAFVVNDVSATNLGYGGKYGYGYSKQQKKWWKF